MLVPEQLNFESHIPYALVGTLARKPTSLSLFLTVCRLIQI